MRARTRHRPVFYENVFVVLNDGVNLRQSLDWGSAVRFVSKSVAPDIELTRCRAHIADQVRHDFDIKMGE